MVELISPFIPIVWGLSIKSLKLGVAAGIAAAALPGTANAAQVVSTSLESANLYPGGNNSFTIGFSDGNLSPDSFTELLTFTTDVSGLLNILVGTTTGENGDINDTDFSTVFLTGTGLNGQVAIPFSMGEPNESRALNNLAVGQGTFTLSISGTPGSQNGLLGGTVSFRQVTAAVPEPGTWAMMLLGFGAIDFSMRRRRSTTAHLYQAA
jgi:hypothetical protein